MEMLNLLESEQNFDEVEDNDEIYERIEAPKYVDLTRPDQFLPDDPSWFCLRIGCDQNHEDVDPDALHRSFVLRVMAARSPNLQLRKAMRSRQVPSAYMKCPMSAPAKPSKPRICRFTVMASISQKTAANVKVKVNHLSKINSTPSAKIKQSSAVAKALTTPRVRNCIPSSDPFRSVQNPKKSYAMTANKVVAKALVFDTPKKSERKKHLPESETPLTEICDGLKMLEINSQRKKASRNSSKFPRCTVTGSKTFRNASDPSRSKMKGHFKNFEDHNDQGITSLQYTKISCTNNMKKFSCPRPYSMANSDMDIDGELKNGRVTVVGNGNEQQLDFVMAQGVTAEQSFPSLGAPLVEVKKRDEDGRTLDLKVTEEPDDSIGVINASVKTLVLDTPKDSERNKIILESETPLTEICDGMKKLEINSQRKKPSWNSSKLLKCTPSYPRKCRTASDPTTSKLYSGKMKSRLNDFEDCKDQGVKSLKCMKSTGTKNSKKSSFPQPQGISGTSRGNEENGNEEQSDFVMPTLEAKASTLEECLPSLETALIEEIAPTVQTDVTSYSNAGSLSNNEKVSEEDYPLNIQIPNEERGIEVREGDEHGNGLKVPEEREDSIGFTNATQEEVPINNLTSYLPNPEEDLEKEEHLETQVFNEIRDNEGNKDGVALELKGSDKQENVSNIVGLESKGVNNDDKENAAASDDRRNSSLSNMESQTNSLRSEAHENQQKVINAHGKALKGNSAVPKKIKPTNPKPFRLRTDERGILREANLEKRQLAPLKEIPPISRNSEGNAQKRWTNEQKVKSHGQFRHESVSQENNQIASDTRSQKIQRQQIKSTYSKKSNSIMEPNTATTSAPAHKKSEHCMEKESQKRELRTTKSQMLRQQHVRIQRGTGTRKTTTISLVASRRLSVIKETASTIYRSKDTKFRNKSTITAAMSCGGRNSSQAKKPLTIPKEPNFHRTQTPKRCTKIVAEATSTPKTCTKALSDVTPKTCTKALSDVIAL